MICDKCKKNAATFFSTVNINGNITETHLCSECANSVNTFNFNSFFNGPALSDFELEQEVRCVCGYTLSDYSQTGMLGCPNCYKTFGDYLSSNLHKFQYGLTHVGKTPVFEDVSHGGNKLKQLELELKKAVMQENYEKASEIKKQINNLKESENG